MKHFTIRLLLVTFALLTTNLVGATQYCKTELQSNGKTIYLSCESPYSNNYLITIEGTNLAGISQYTYADEVDMSRKIASQSPTKIVIRFDLSYTPNLSSLSVKFSDVINAVSFNVNNVEWGTCATPTMHSAAEVDGSRTATSVKVSVSATDAEGNSINTYNVSTDGGVTKTKMTATDNTLSFEGLTPSTTYNLQIWAVDGNGVESKDYVPVQFTTPAASSGSGTGSGETGIGAAATYCQTDLTSGTNTITLTTMKVSEGNYRLVIEGENLTGLGGTYYNPGNVHLGEKITTQTSTKIICDITAPSAPKFYTPLYVLMPGEVKFEELKEKDIVWGICDDPCLEGNGVDWAAGALCSAGFFEGSSAEVPVTTYVPDKAVDGDTNTRWGSYGSGEAPDWWQVDLEEIRMLDSIRIMFSTCDIVGYAVKGSTDANSWFTLLEVNDAPLIDRYINHPLPENSMARYLRVEPIGGTFMSFWEFNAFGTCERISSKPVMVSAVVDEESIGETSVKVQVGAIDKETSFPNIKYNVVITTGSSVGSKTTLTATDGILTISGLVGYKNYSVEIWAVDGNRNESENSKVVEFTTAPYTGLYLREWNGGNGNSIRFRKTAVSGVYVGQLALPAGTFTYYLEDKNTGKTTTTNGGERPLVLKVPTTVTFYAKDVDTFASNADSIFLSGPAVGCGTSDWATCGETRLCIWDGDKAVWTGEIDPTEVYGICKIAHPSNGNTDVYPQDIMKGTEKPDVTGTSGTFTFDLPTFT